MKKRPIPKLSIEACEKFLKRSKETEERHRLVVEKLIKEYRIEMKEADKK